MPGQRRIHAASGQSIELSLAQLAELHGVAPVAKVGRQDSDGETFEAVAQRRVEGQRRPVPRTC
jgi:hypothetical protein